MRKKITIEVNIQDGTTNEEIEKKLNKEIESYFIRLIKDSFWDNKNLKLTIEDII